MVIHEDHTLNTQQIENLQRLALETQHVPPPSSQLIQSGPSDSNNSLPSSGSSPENAQRPRSTSSYKIPESQLSESSAAIDRLAFPYLTDSFNYHADRITIRDSSQLSDIPPTPSAIGVGSTGSRQQGGDESPFKVPSLATISVSNKSSDKTQEERDVGDSSLDGIGEPSPRLSQFFLATQHSQRDPLRSPPQTTRRQVAEEVVPSPLERKRISTYERLADIEEQQRRQAEEEAAAEEARRKEEEDSFAILPQSLRNKWAIEEKAHRVFDELRQVEVKLDKKGVVERGMGDLFFDTKTVVDADGVTRIIKTGVTKSVSERGQGSDEEESNDNMRKRASTAPVRDGTSNSTIILNSQPSNPHTEINGSHDTNGSVIKETPVNSTPKSRPQSASEPTGNDSSQILESWSHHSAAAIATPLRPEESITNIPSSLPHSVTRQSLETPAPKPISKKDLTESVPETSPVKEDGTEEGEVYRTAQESFQTGEADSSPPFVPGRRRSQNGFVASSIPSNPTQQRKRERPPKIHEDVSEGEGEGEDQVTDVMPKVPARKRRRVRSASGLDIKKLDVVSPPPMPAESTTESQRVMARFKNAKINYYPATVVEPPCVMSADQPAPLDSEVLVRFDDDTETAVQLRHIKRFHLDEGQTVRIQGEKNTFTVQRFEKDPTEQGHQDIFGHNVIIVTRLKTTTPELRFPIGKVFLTGTLFAQLKHKYTTTWCGRGRYIPTSLSRQVSSSPNLTRAPARTTSPLFKNMVFAISFVQEGKNTLEEMKTSLSDKIKMHSGTVFDDGLREMFATVGESQTLELDPSFEETAFCAVLANQYSRKPKYLEALALGVPCLAHRWIEDCVTQNRIVDWQNYLLPAGESEYLGNVVKSMIVEPFSASESLSDRLNRRTVPFGGQKILVISSAKRKADKDKSANFHFLLRALGAQVFTCSSSEEANQFLSRGEFTSILADNDDIKLGRQGRGVKIRLFEGIIQGLIFGAFEDT